MCERATCGLWLRDLADRPGGLTVTTLTICRFGCLTDNSQDRFALRGVARLLRRHGGAPTRRTSAHGHSRGTRTRTTPNGPGVDAICEHAIAQHGRTTRNVQHATWGREHLTWGRRRRDRHHATDNAACNRQRTADNIHHATCNVQHATDACAAWTGRRRSPARADGCGRVRRRRTVPCVCRVALPLPRARPHPQVSPAFAKRPAPAAHRPHMRARARGAPAGPSLHQRPPVARAGPRAPTKRRHRVRLRSRARRRRRRRLSDHWRA